MFYKTILFDFDGVLCHDPFFGSLKESHPKVYEFIQNRIFYKGSDIPDKWMRAQITSGDICRYISKNTGIDIGYLSNALIEDTKKMRIEKRLLGFAKNLIKNNKKIALITDNMDIFDIIAKNHELDKYFPLSLILSIMDLQRKILTANYSILRLKNWEQTVIERRY